MTGDPDNVDEGGGAQAPADSFEGESDVESLVARITALEKLVVEQGTAVDGLKREFEENNADDFVDDNELMEPQFDDEGDSSGIDYSNWAFGWSSYSSSPVTINPGTLRITGKGNIKVAGADVPISGTPVWIYVVYDRIQASATLTFASSEPVSDASFLRLPLLNLEMETGGSYRLASTNDGICHVGDFIFDSPI